MLHSRSLLVIYFIYSSGFSGFPGGSRPNQEGRMPMQVTWVQSLGHEDPLEKEMATHSSILAQEIPWRKEPGRHHGITKESDTTEQLNKYICQSQLPSLSLPASFPSPANG